MVTHTVTPAIRIALVTCAELPTGDDDSRLVIAPLADHGLQAEPAVWDDLIYDWSQVDLAIVRSCWDYVPRRGEFLAWAERVTRLANPAAVLRWNTEKRYLLDLQEAGVPIVATDWVHPGESWSPPAHGQWVVKPSVSLSSKDTGRYRLDDRGDRQLAVAHMRRLQAEQRVAMVQPYLAGVEGEGETSLVFFNGAFSHAVRKAAVLHGPDTGDASGHGFDVPGEDPRLRDASAAQLALAQAAMDAVPGGADQLLFARVDVVPGPNGQPVLMELELTEPMLFLAVAPGAPERFAAAIAARCARP